MIETTKVPEGEAKSVVIENGSEITYCECGEENEDIIIVGQWYFLTFWPWLKAMGEKYHVYGMVMRLDGGTITQYAEDGGVWWEHQWAEDIYQFAKALGISKFTYCGKCHGSFPGFCLAQQHPEVLNALVSVSMVPGGNGPLLESKNFNYTFGDLRFGEGEGHGEEAFLHATIRKEENIPKKVAEGKTIDVKAAVTAKHICSFDNAKNYDEVIDACKKLTTPFLLVYATDDPGFDDWYASAIYPLIKQMAGMKVVLLQGERHFVEMDVPEKLGREITFYLDELKMNYT